jgi:hypothetical protein
MSENATLGYVLRTVPTFNDVVHPCSEREALEPPARRMETCTCLVDGMMKSLATARAMALTHSARELIYRANLNACRTLAFSRSVGNAVEARMSPLPLVTRASVN